MKVVWSPRALEQLWSIIEYIGRDDLAAAWSVRDRIVERVERLAEFPELGPPGRMHGTRELNITGTSHVAVYRVTAKELRIVAVWHTSQSRRRKR